MTLPAPTPAFMTLLTNLLWAAVMNTSNLVPCAMLAEGAALLTLWHSKSGRVEKLPQDHECGFQPREHAQGTFRTITETRAHL